MDRQSAPVDGFRLAYERTGNGPAVVLLHGWPGNHSDYRAVVPLLQQHAAVVVPDLRGFGESDKHPQDPAAAYSADAQARSVLGLIDELGLTRPLIAGYDIGSRIAQAIARLTPDRIREIVVTPPLPGVGDRVLTAPAQRAFWYQAFHQLPLAEELIDGKPAAVRAYLGYFWSSWSGPAYEPSEADLDELVRSYAAPGAFTASIAWYRAGSGTVARSLSELTPAPDDRIAAQIRVLWPEQDPLFPTAWADRLGEFFSDVSVRTVADCGHFVPLEAPQVLADEILAQIQE